MLGFNQTDDVLQTFIQSGNANKSKWIPPPPPKKKAREFRELVFLFNFIFYKICQPMLMNVKIG